MLKNKLVALATALAVVATPVAALAAVSPNTVSSSASAATVSANVSANKSDGNAWIKIESTDAVASNVPEDQKADVVASFEVTHDGTEAPYTFSYTLGTEYANATVTVYIQHDDGTTEVITRTADANGTISFTQEKLCIHTLVAKKSNGAAASTDTSSRSPQTGINTAAVAGVSVAAVVTAAGVALVLRKKVNE